MPAGVNIEKSIPLEVCKVTEPIAVDSILKPVTVKFDDLGPVRNVPPEVTTKYIRMKPIGNIGMFLGANGVEYPIDKIPSTYGSWIKVGGGPNPDWGGWINTNAPTIIYQPY